MVAGGRRDETAESLLDQNELLLNSQLHVKTDRISSSPHFPGGATNSLAGPIPTEGDGSPNLPLISR